MAVVLATPDYTVVSDPADYERHALAIAGGHWPPPDRATTGPTAYRPPLYPLFLGAAVKAEPGAGRTWPRIAQAVVGTLTVALLGLVALQLFGPRVATVAMAIGAVYPSMWMLSAAYLSEVLFVPLVLGAVAAALRYRRDPRLRWLGVCGGLVGLATLTRANAPLLLLPLLLAAWRPGGLRAAAVLVAACALAMAPWTIRNAVELERFVPVSTEAGYTLSGTYNDLAREGTRFPASRYPAAWVEWYAVPENQAVLRRAAGNEVDQSHALRAHALRYARDHPGYAVKVAWWNLRRIFDASGRDYVRFDVAGIALPERLADFELYPFWALGALALVGVFTAPARRAPAWVWLVPAVLLSAVVVVGYIRFRAPIDPFLVMLASLGALAVVDRATSGSRVGHRARW